MGVRRVQPSLVLSVLSLVLVSEPQPREDWIARAGRKRFDVALVVVLLQVFLVYGARRLRLDGVRPCERGELATENDLGCRFTKNVKRHPRSL